MGIAKSIVKNTTFEFITEISELGVAFVIGIVLTRGLGTEQYGLYAYALWLLALTAMITNLGLGEMNRRFIPEAIGRQNSTESAGFVQLAFIYKIGVSLIVCIVIFITSSYWARMSGSSNNQLVFFLIALMVLPAALSKALEMIFKGFQRFDYSLYISLASNPLRLALTVLLVVLGFGVVAVIMLNIITTTLSVLIGLFLLHRLIPLRSLFARSLLSRERRNEALKYAFTLMGILVLGYLVSQQAETFFIGLYCSVEDVGFYTLAFKIGTIMGVFPAAFGYVLLPAITEQFGRGDTEKMKRIYVTAVRYLMMLALPIAVGGIVLADSIITLLYGADYAPTIILFQVVSLPIAITSINSACDAVIRGINRPGFLLVTMVFLAIVNILGAAVTNAVIMIFYLPIYIVFLNKKVGVTWPVRDTLRIIASVAVMGVVVYILHSHLGLIFSLVVCIPLGAAVYVAAIFSLRVIRKEDVELFRGLQNSIPISLRKSYTFLINVAERFVIKKGIVTDVDS
jgi:O-antigen/teichoic acid export membrane protein